MAAVHPGTVCRHQPQQPPTPLELDGREHLETPEQLVVRWEPWGSPLVLDHSEHPFASGAILELCSGQRCV